MIHINVRAATADDRVAVLALLRALHAETPHAALSEGRLREGWDEALSIGVIIVSEQHPGRPVGTVALVPESPWFSDEVFLCDRWMYVHPEYRHSPHARLLLRSCRRLAAEQAIPLHMSVAGYGDRTAGKIRLFSRELGPPCGATWVIRNHGRTV
jgi:GNAT superfamily N-acetyltransferase